MVKHKIAAALEGIRDRAQYLINNPDQIDDELFKVAKVAGDKVNEVKAAVQERLK